MGYPFLLIGLSRFARRRVLAAVDALDCFDAVRVASRSASDDALSEVPGLAHSYRDYEEALSEAPPGIAYVSLTNHAHDRWVERALERGHHVVVDKPAFLDLATTQRLAELAAAKGRLLAEATTYAFHPVVHHTKRIFADRGSRPALLTASFTPPVPKDDYRWRRDLGGGALADTGPYCASIGRLIWGCAPVHVSARINARDGADGIDTAYSVLLDYGHGRTLVGHFGFTCEYTNHLELLGQGLRVDVPRIFSTPPDMTTEIAVRERNVSSIVESPPADATKRFLQAVIEAIETGDHALFATALLADARVREQIATAAGT